MMKNRKKIAIIGGGIAGLTFARCLTAADYDIHIFEAKENFGEIGAAISVFPNALCVMDYLGILNNILESSGHIKTVYLKTSTGKVLSKSEPEGDYPVICMHRADLHRILLENIDAKLYNNYSLDKLTHQADGRIELGFKNGENLLFDAVI